MVKRILLLLLLLSMISLVIADNQEPTYEDFLQNPTAADFSTLSEANQDIYIRDLTTFNGDNFAMAQDYFNRANKINENPESFSKFMGSQSIDIGVAGSGDYQVTIESKDGKITHAKFDNGETNIDLNSFKAVYSYVIDDKGKLQLISGGKEYPITGAVTKGDYAELVIAEGSIAGFDVKNGDFRIDNGKIYGVADKFGEMVFGKDESGTPGIFIYDIAKNEMTLKKKPHWNPDSYSLEGPEDVIFHSRPDNMIIIAPFKTIFLEQGEAFENMKVEYKNGKPVSLVALEDKSRAMIGGISHRIHNKDAQLNLCYDIACFDKSENSFYYGDKSFAIKGNGFESVFDKQRILDFKGARTTSAGGEVTKIDRPVIKTKLWAETIFLGSSEQRSSDYYDYVLMSPHGGSLEVKSDGKKWTGSADGKMEVQNGYWAIASNGERVYKNEAYNPHNYDFVGADAVDFEIDFKMSDGNTEAGYQFIDEKRRPDLFHYPFRYTGINPNGFSPQNEEEFREYYIFNLKLLMGQPLDFYEGRSQEEIQHTNEFVCVDVVASAYKLTTGRDMLEEKARLGEGKDWGSEARRNWELRPFFKASRNFATKQFNGNDWVQNVPAIHGKTHTKNTKITVPREQLTFPQGGIEPDWEGKYGLEKDKVQYVMFEKQYVKCEGNVCKYNEGSQTAHIVPVFWQQGKWVTIQAPGDCRSDGVCEIPLTNYINRGRCKSDAQLSKGCVAHYGVRQVVKPKAQPRRIAQS